MSDRKVARNGNYKFGEAMCSGCSSSGPVTTLQGATCRLCRKPNCANCAIGRTAEDRHGLCRSCAKKSGYNEHPPGMVTFVYVDADPAGLIRERERGIHRSEQRARMRVVEPR